MKYVFYTLIIMMTFVSCIEQNTTNNLLTKEIRYSAFFWYENPENDSLNFYLAYYLDISKDGKFILMRHDSKLANRKFIKGTISDTLQKLIETTFIKDTFDTDYKWNVKDGFLYCGYTYSFDIINSDSNSTKRIFFIPRKAPSNLNRLAKALDSMIYHMNIGRTDSIDIHFFEGQLKNSYDEKYGQLPQPQKVKVFRLSH